MSAALVEVAPLVEAVDVRKVYALPRERLTAPAPLVRTRIGLLGRRIVGAIGKLALLLRELDGPFDIALHMTMTATMVNSARAMNAY